MRAENATVVGLALVVSPASPRARDIPDDLRREIRRFNGMPDPPRDCAIFVASLNTTPYVPSLSTYPRPYLLV